MHRISSRILPILILLFSQYSATVPLSAQSAAGLEGHVLDAQGNPLEGTHVRVEGCTSGTITNPDGSFLLTGLQPGRVILRISHVGYAPLQRQVTLSSGSRAQVEVRLQPRSVELGAVTVTATRMHDLLRNIPQPVSVIAARTLFERQPVSVPDALDAEAGLQLVRDGVWGTDIAIRGLQRANVVTLIDGVRIETATAHAAGMSLVDVSDVRRIEVLRGGSSSMYGSGATGGVVQIQTRSGGFSPVLQFAGTVESGIATVNNAADAALSVDAMAERWYLHAHGRLRAAEDTQTPDGVLRDSRFHDNSIAVAGGMRITEAQQFRVRWQRMRAEDVGIPGGASFPEFASARYPDEEREMFSAEYVIDPLGSVMQRLSLAVARQRIDRNVEIIPNPAVTLRPSAEHDMWSTQATAHLQMGSHTVRSGVDAWQRRYEGIRLREIAANNTTIADLPLPVARFRSVGLFVQDDVPLVSERLRLSAGGRLDAIHVENDEAYDLQYIIRDGVRTADPPSRSLRWPAATSDELSWSAHAGLLWQATDATALTLNLSHAFRAPSLEERYQYIELGAATYVGDPDLAAEKGSMVDLGLRLELPDAALRVNGYLRSMRDLVVDAKLSDTLYRKENVGEAVIYGFELAGEYRLFGRATAYASIEYLRGRDTGLDEDLPQMAPFGGRLGLRGNIADAVEADVFTSFAADQRDVAPGELATPGYVLLHLRLRSLPISLGGLRLQLLAGVDNLLDQSWRRHLSTLRGIIVSEPGRNFILRLRLHW
ncbi:TonB-dependent receptor [bacterium]|nr:TonB-dependent receptor [bacterium]